MSLILSLLVAAEAASAPVTAPVVAELADNSDVLYCFLKEADMRHDPPLPPGDGEYNLFGLQFERDSKPTEPVTRMHDPNGLFGGSQITRISSAEKTALFFSAPRQNGGTVVLTIAFQGAKNGNFLASVGYHLPDGKPDDSGPFLAGNCAWMRATSGSNIMFAAIQKDKPTLIRGKQ